MCQRGISNEGRDGVKRLQGRRGGGRVGAAELVPAVQGSAEEGNVTLQRGTRGAGGGGSC